MAAKKQRWKMIIAVIIYVGVAAGGYAYFAVQNPVTQLARVASTQTLTSVQADLREVLSRAAEDYVSLDIKDVEFPATLGGLPVSDEAAKEGVRVIEDLFELIETTDREEMGIPNDPNGITTIFVDRDANYGSERIRPLPARTAGVTTGVAVQIEYYDGTNQFGSSWYTELGVIVDGPSQTITQAVDPNMVGW